MRHHEAGLLDNLITVQDQVEIERARGARMRPLAPEAILDLEQSGQQRSRIEGGLPYDGCIEETRLVADADWRGVMK